MFKPNRSASRNLPLSFWRMFWPGAYTTLALPWVGVVWLTGGQVSWQRSRGTLGLCAHSGWFVKILRWHPLGPMLAVTIGHVVVAQNHHALKRTLVHEFVHIRQFERWGLIFPALYMAESLRSAVRGQGLYRGNRFELAAYAAERES